MLIVIRMSVMYNSQYIYKCLWNDGDDKSLDGFVQSIIHHRKEKTKEIRNKT